MKLVFVFVAASALRVAAQSPEVTMTEVNKIGMLPGEKMSLPLRDLIKPTSRNPFAERSKVKQEEAVETVETEQAKLTRYFQNTEITGVTVGTDGKRTALLGEIFLEEGKPVPQVLPGQTHVLRCTRISDNLVELSFLTGSPVAGGVQGYRIRRPIDLKPKVEARMANSETDLIVYDDTGKVIAPERLSPNPASLIANLPPNTMPSAADEEAVADSAVNTAPPADGTDPAGIRILPPAETAGGPVPAPPPAAEDEVVEDPETSPPAPPPAPGQ